MLQGEVIGDGWKDDAVKKTLDLCLACKACKAECPANVDMATYKAEFLSHYYEGRLRPVRAYAFGMINKWANFASYAPAAANFISSAPGLNRLLKRVLSMAPERQMPKFASPSFRGWARSNNVSYTGDDLNQKRRNVILWVDTFNNYFHPQTSRAALKVLTRAGFTVRIPKQNLCCGRPLYDFGMLNLAKKYLERVMEALRPQINLGIPIVVLEPSCVSVFRDEVGNLFPRHPIAGRLRDQTFLLSEFLEYHAPDFCPPRLSRPVLFHGHCHQKALMKMTADESLLRKMGVDLQTVDAGCCGMAGPFGFERDTFEISQAIGERVLLPAVRRADAGSLILADGFSCQEQIFQATGRRPIHLAELLGHAYGDNVTAG